MILALDLGTTMGVAAGNPHASPAATTISLPDSTQGARLWGAMVALDKLVAQHKPDHIAIERPVVAGVAGARSRPEIAMGLAGIVHLIGYKRRVKVHAYDLGAIRSFFVGSSVARQKGKGKPATLERCRRWGWVTTASMDEADACAVWAYARLQLAGVSMPEPWGMFDRPEP